MDKPPIETADQSEQGQTARITEKFDQAASRARDAVTDAKETVVGTVTTQGEHAIEKVKEGVHTIEGTAKDYVYIVAVSCLALGFVLGLLVHRGSSKSRFSHPMNWVPWS